MPTDDDKTLDLLAMFHYIVGGITAFFSCFPFIHLFLGISIVSGDFIDSKGAIGPPEALFGWIFIILGATFIIFGWALAVCMIIAGRYIKQRKKRMFCFVIAAIECMLMPFGTVLGIFTLINLNKDSVKALFNES